MNDIHFRRVAADAFDAASPDALMASVSRSALGRSLAVSVAAHIIAILLLSIGNISLCVKYRTINPRHAMAQRNEAMKEEATRKQAAQSGPDQEMAGPEVTGGQIADEPSGTNDPRVPDAADRRRIPPEIEERSNERPLASSLESIDDLFAE